MSLECLGNLHPYVVVLPIQPPASLRVDCVEPGLADDGDEHVARGDGLINAVDEVFARPDGIDVDEDILAAEVLPEPIGQPAGVGGTVVTTIVDENPGHAPTSLVRRYGFYSGSGSRAHSAAGPEDDLPVMSSAPFGPRLAGSPRRARPWPLPASVGRVCRRRNNHRTRASHSPAPRPIFPRGPRT